MGCVYEATRSDGYYDEYGKLYCGPVYEDEKGIRPYNAARDHAEPGPFLTIRARTIRARKEPKAPVPRQSG
jgi:hypothetical protein